MPTLTDENFEEALMDLIDRAVEDGVNRAGILSALELRVMALQEELRGQ